MTRSYALLGSGEFEPWSEEMDRWMLGRVARPQGPVLILPTASAPEGDEVFDRWADMGLRHFEGQGMAAEVVPLKTRGDASRPDLVARLGEGSSVYFSGGNPAYLASVLADTPFWRAVVAGMDEGLGYAGCSAGISALGELAPDSSVRDFTQDIWRLGLGLFPKVVFGPHWDMLDTYIPGLQTLFAAAVPPDHRLFAVDERTAAVGDGTEWTVIGLGKARLHDQDGWREWGPGDPFSVRLDGVG